MNPMLQVNLAAIASRLDEVGVKWCLIGGMAVSARSEPRFTRDVDLAVSVDDDRAAEAIIRGLTVQGWETLAVLEQTATGRLATVRLFPPGSVGDRIVVDLLFASSGIEPEIVAASSPLEVFPGLSVPVAAIPHLLVMKLLAANDRERYQDLADIEGLLKEASEAQLGSVEALLDLVTARGNHRGKDLKASFHTFLRKAGLSP